MPVKKPQRVLGKSIALKSAQKRIQQRASRAAWASLNLTAMVDIFTTLVVFLLANFSATGEILFMTKEIELPKAQATAEILRAPVISISSSAVSLEGERVYFTEEAARQDVSTLSDITYQLQEMRKTEEILRPGQLFKGTVVLQCDEKIEFNVVRKVMYAAAAAGYVDINYAVISKGKAGVAPAK
ncbi:MAG: biopolymer transporter ExbD [Deltaproteobacteria bacterium]|nr:biopolymer transporter ExbD [Deltaproteobacteria bacterium]